MLLEDFDCKELGHFLKEWADRYSTTGETKFGTIQLRHHYFVITSNYSIDEIFGYDDKLKEAL